MYISLSSRTVAGRSGAYALVFTNAITRRQREGKFGDIPLELDR